MALWILFGTTRVSRYQKKCSPTHTYLDYQSSFICFRHLIQSMASSMFNLRAWQSFCTTSDQVFFSLPLDLAPSASYYIHFFTQSSPSFHSTAHTITTSFPVVPRLWHLIPSISQLFTCNSVFYLNATHPSNHSHLCPLKCHLIFFSYSYVSLLCNILLRTQLLYNLPLTINDMSSLVSNGTNCLNLFHPFRILASTAASASPSTLNMSPK